MAVPRVVPRLLIAVLIALPAGLPMTGCAAGARPRQATSAEASSDAAERAAPDADAGVADAETGTEAGSVTRSDETPVEAESLRPPSDGPASEPGPEAEARTADRSRNLVVTPRGIDVIVEPERDAVGACRLRVRFDPTVLRLVAVDSPVFGSGSGGLLLDDEDLDRGEAVLHGYRVDAEAPSGAVRAVRLRFAGVGRGTSRIHVDLELLATPDGTPVPGVAHADPSAVLARPADEARPMEASPPDEEE